jgi:hypothetical protein
MEGEEAEGHPLRHLQFEMAVVVEAVRVARVQQSGENAARDEPVRRIDQEVRRHARKPERRQQQQVYAITGVRRGRFSGTAISAGESSGRRTRA